MYCYFAPLFLPTNSRHHKSMQGINTYALPMNPLAQWSNFYVAVAGASAALTGLIFVGVSISLAKILSIPSLPNRALVSLILLLNVLDFPCCSWCLSSH